MKLRILIAFLLLSAGLSAQPPGTTQTVAGSWKYFWFATDSALKIPTDTATRALNGSIAIKTGNFYFKTGGVWTVFSGGITYSAGYGVRLVGSQFRFDSANVRKTDSVYNVNDSTFGFSINGVPRTFKFRGAVTSVAGRTGAVVISISDIAGLTAVLNAKADLTALADTAHDIRASIIATTGITRAELQDTAADIRADFPVGGGVGDTTALMRKANNLGDVVNKPTARTNLGLGTGAVLNAPASGNASATELVKGNDTRLNQFAPFKTGTIILGNSITKGCCSDGTYTPWVEFLSQQLGGVSYTNFAISGSGVRKQTAEMFYKTGGQKFAPIGLFTGFNNSRVSTDTAAHGNTIRSAYRAIVSSQFLDHIEAPAWTNTSVNSNVTYSNGNGQASSLDSLIDWGSQTMWYRLNDPNNAGANWFNKASVVANETITIASLTGSNIFIGTWGYFGSPASRIKVTVDGVDKITWDPNNRTYLGQPEGFIRDGIINDAIIINGLTNVSHTVVITFLDGGKRGAIDCFGSLRAPVETDAIPAHILAFPHMTSVGYNYPGGEVTPAILDGFTASLKADLQYTFPGYAMNFIAINGPGKYDPDNYPDQVSGDGIHPNNRGQKNIADAVFATWFKMAYAKYYNIESLGTDAITAGNKEILISNGSTQPGAYSIGMLANSSSGVPAFFWNSKLAPTDQKLWDVYSDNTSLTWRMINDAQNDGAVWMKVQRFGMQVQNVSFPSSGVTAKHIYSSVTETVDSTLTLGNKPIGMGQSNRQRPFIYWRNNAAATDQKMWDMYADPDTFHFRSLSDNNTLWKELMQFVGRTGISVDKVVFPSTKVVFKTFDIGSNSDSAWTKNPSTGAMEYSKINSGVGATNVTITRNATTVTVNSSTGTPGVILKADSTNAGVMDTTLSRYVLALKAGTLSTTIKTSSDFSPGATLDSLLLNKVTTIADNETKVPTTDAVYEYVREGDYAPTLTNGANVTSSTTGLCSYIKVGNKVIYSGRLSVTLTTSYTNSVVSITLPVASNFTVASDCTGSMGSIDTGLSGAGVANATTDKIDLKFLSNSLSGVMSVDFHLTYYIK